MMAKRRMVFVRDLGADARRRRRAAARVLRQAESVDGDRRDRRRKLDKRLKLFAPRRRRAGCTCSRRRASSRRGCAPRRRRASVELDAAAITRLVDTVGNDLSRLALAVEQLGLYAGDRAGDVRRRRRADRRYPRALGVRADRRDRRRGSAARARRGRVAVRSARERGRRRRDARAPHPPALAAPRDARAATCRAASGAAGSACRRSSSTS